MCRNIGKRNEFLNFPSLGALEDMHRAQPKKRGNSIGGSSIKPATDGVDWNPSENVWTEEFLQQAAVTFESNMATLLSSFKGTSGEKSIDNRVNDFIRF